MAGFYMVGTIEVKTVKMIYKKNSKKKKKKIKTQTDSASLILFSCEEAVVQKCSVKKVFLEISQNSLENTRVRDYVAPQACTSIKKETLAQLFVNLAKFLRTTFLQNTSGGCFCLCFNPFQANVSFMYSLIYPLKTSGFLTFSGCIEMENCHEIS